MHICCTCTSAEAQPVYPLCVTESYILFSLPTVSLTAVWNTTLVLSKIQKWMCAQSHTSRTSLEMCSSKHIQAAFCTVSLGLSNDFLRKEINPPPTEPELWACIRCTQKSCILELDTFFQQELTNYSYPIKKEVMVTDIEFVGPQATLPAYLTHSLPWCHLKTTNNSAKFQNLKEKGCGRIFMKTQNIESRCYRTRKYTVCRHVCASFSPEILQAAAVKGLSVYYSAQSSDAVCLLKCSL